MVTLKKFDGSKIYVIAHTDGIKSCTWEGWEGPDITSKHPWTEYHRAPSTIGIVKKELGTYVASYLELYCELGSVGNLSFVEWDTSDEALQTNPIYPGGLKLKIKLTVESNIESPFVGYAYIEFVAWGNSGEYVEVVFLQYGLDMSGPGVIISDDNEGVEQVFDLSSYFSLASDITTMRVYTVIGEYPGNTFAGARIKTVIDYMHFV